MIINGVKSTELDARDRGLQYGDGCFTTLLTRNGQLCMWPEHKARLQQALERLHIPFDQWSSLESHVQQHISDDEKAVIKIVITRGPGGRGYDPAGAQHSQWILSHFDYPAHYHQWQKQGIHLELSPIKLARQPLLAGIKHLNRLEQVMVKQQAASLEADDVLVCDTLGNMIETSAANLFWRKGNSWFSPDLSQAGIEGVMRNHIIRMIKKSGGNVQIVNRAQRALEQADEAFICNSLMQLVPIKSFQDVTYKIRDSRAIQEQILC